MIPEPCNVLFIVIDALRPDAVGCYRSHKSATPNIDKIAKDGIMFEQAFACCNATDSSLTSLFSGKYPLSHGIQYHGEDVPTEAIDGLASTVFLPEILKSHGYTTIAVDWLDRWHKRGYDYYVYAIERRSVLDVFARYRDLLYPKIKLAEKLGLAKIPALRNRLKSPPYPRADTITHQATRFLEECCEKFFLFVHYWDTHTPYYSKNHPVSNRFQSTVEDIISQSENAMLRRRLLAWAKATDSIDEIIGRYYGAATFVDSQIGELVKVLKNCGILENTLIVLTSDHGESLTEHGVYFDHHGLYDTTIHVPLILRGPRIPKGKTVDGLIQHTDIVPTLLDLLDMKVNLGLNGKSLLALSSGEINELHPAVFVQDSFADSRIGIRTRQFKYLYSAGRGQAICKRCKTIHGELEELYNLEDDPDEKRNVVTIQNEPKQLLKDRLLQWRSQISIERNTALTIQSEHVESQEEKDVKDRLRRLGYF